MGPCSGARSHTTAAPWVREGDIQACVDESSQDWRLATIPLAKAVRRGWLNAGDGAEDARYPTEAGTPPGGLSSPVLANLTRNGLARG